MNKAHYAQIEQARAYKKNNGQTAYKFKVSREKWDDEKKKYDGWEDKTVFSDTPHKVGDGIYYVWDAQRYKYVEVEPDEDIELPF